MMFKFLGCANIHPTASNVVVTIGTESIRFMLLVPFLCMTQPSLHGADWPSWRGAGGTGVAAAEEDPPTHWTTEFGVKWKAPLPGPGNSSPIVIGERIFLTQFSPESRERLLLCFDASDGKELWRHAEVADVDEWTHPSNPLCAASPVSNGSVVLCFFGQPGLFCFDLDGKVLWNKSWGTPQHLFGGGPSPVLVNDIVVVTFGPGVEQFYAGLSVVDGAELWRIDMPRVDAVNPLEGPNAPPLPKETDLRDPFGSWATPVVLNLETGVEVILTMPGELRGVAPETGETLWTCTGPAEQVLGSPAFGAGVLALQGGTAMAIKPGGRGDVGETQVQWTMKNDPARIGSPIIVGDYLFGITMNGIVDCSRISDGERLWRERMSDGGANGGSWGSLVAANGRIYALTQSGTTYVFEAASTYKPLSINPLGEATNASPAIAGMAIYIRTNNHLWCISTNSI